MALAAARALPNSKLRDGPAIVFDCCDIVLSAGHNHSLELSSNGLGVILRKHDYSRFRNSRKTASWRAGSGPSASGDSVVKYSKVSKIMLRSFENASSCVSPDVPMFASKNVALNPSRSLLSRLLSRTI